MRLEELLPLPLIGVSCLLLPHPDAGPCRCQSKTTRSGQENRNWSANCADAESAKELSTADKKRT
ncbi:hypothetical protein CCHR01_10853 [Colletotrichum chrysophilum]|uniref:Uncharacterized protein n=1 Tax=Colletotrichum chrysophilum TaxID=1836956 RepID=A0AAD9AFT2_9PEZI|nr:hypothetical protein K456DRAFT_57331 [Colletotrichum gloeosporioides 23]KAK1846515.1 hypothetical protein CCHR01_10853 [Colletotrichum chrysophilum]